MNATVNPPVESFGPAIRAIMAAIPLDAAVREGLVKNGMQVLRDHGAPVDALTEATKAELATYLSNTNFDEALLTSTLSCNACEWGLGFAILLVGGAAAIVAAILMASGGWAVTAIVGAIAAAGLVVSAATISTILAGLVGMEIGAAGLAFSEFIPRVCSAAGACPSAQPLDPAIEQWIGQDVLCIGSSTTPMTSISPPSISVFDHILYLATGAGSPPTISLSTLNITSGTAWEGGDQLVINGNPLPALAQPAMASGTVGTETTLFMVYMDSADAMNWTSFDGTSWSTPATVVVNGTTVTGANKMVTATVAYGKLYVCYNAAGNLGMALYDGTTWAGGGVFAAGGSAIPIILTPSLVNYKNQPYLFYVQANSDKISFTRQPMAVTPWTTPEVIDVSGRGSMQTTLGVSACAYASKIYLFYRSYHHNFLYWATYDGTKWVVSQIKEPYLSGKTAEMANITTVMPFSLTASDEDERLFLTYLPNDGTSQVHWTMG